jgi:hypothetical protein
MSNVTDILGWNGVIWDAIKQAVHDETQRTKIAQKVLPIHGPLADVMNIPSNITEEDKDGLTITERASTNSIETQLFVDRFVMAKGHNISHYI